jgi:hypothetical protein
LLPPIEQIRRGNVFVIGAGLSASATVLPDRYELLGSFIWKWPEQHRVQHGEDRRRGADAKCQCRDDRRAEHRMRNETPHGEPRVLNETVDEREAADVAEGFLRRRAPRPNVARAARSASSGGIPKRSFCAACCSM